MVHLISENKNHAKTKQNHRFSWIFSKKVVSLHSKLIHIQMCGDTSHFPNKRCLVVFAYKLFTKIKYSFKFPQTACESKGTTWACNSVG